MYSCLSNISYCTVSAADTVIRNMGVKSKSWLGRLYGRGGSPPSLPTSLSGRAQCCAHLAFYIFYKLLPFCYYCEDTFYNDSFMSL